ncbi:MAG: hypothetical protein RSB41_00430 [Bacilli bacterium]
MKESIGGTWLLGLVVLFIVLFSAFLAISINYTKAFKVKNQIINIIEQNEGYSNSSKRNLSSVSDSELRSSKNTEDKVYLYIRSIGYASESISQNKCNGIGDKEEGGYCIQRICTENGSYYKVTSFVKIELPLMWQSFTVPISGETKAIYKDNSNLSGPSHRGC